MRPVAAHLAAALAIVAGASCRSATPAQVETAPPAPPARPPIVQPGAPGQASVVIDAATAADLSRVQFTPADVKFMQGMIGHHLQAMDMVALLKERTTWDGMRKLGLRIEVSQEDEIHMMERWLQVHGQDVPGPHMMHMRGAVLMPGMLTEDEMARLGAVRGARFDRLFLEGMIKHHAGAIAMVEQLFATPGAGQDADIFAFASDVVSDQRMEIDRMAAMLATVMEHQK